jgi:hypothetical protein
MNMDDLLKTAQEIGIRQMIENETRLRDRRIAELEKQLADQMMPPWRKAIESHWGDEVLKATTPDDAVRAAWFKGYCARLAEFEREFAQLIQKMKWDKERCEKEYLGQ